MIKRLGEFWRQRRCMMEVDLWCLGDIGNSGLPSWEFIVGCWGPRNRTVETSVFASEKNRWTCSTHSFVHSLFKKLIKYIFKRALECSTPGDRGR